MNNELDWLYEHCSYIPKEKKKKPYREALFPSSKVLKKYSLTRDVYNQMKEEQGGKCLICLGEDKLVIDHCHTSLRVRGLLCYRCNLLIGLAKEKIEILRGAILYLEEY